MVTAQVSSKESRYNRGRRQRTVVESCQDTSYNGNTEIRYLILHQLFFNLLRPYGVPDYYHSDAFVLLKNSPDGQFSIVAGSTAFRAPSLGGLEPFWLVMSVLQ